MGQIPEDLLYSKEHEWVRVNDDGTAVIGITDYAQESLGDITFVELPEAGAVFGFGDPFGVVESVKAASDLYMPAECEVLEVNHEVDANPALVNDEPYGRGWLVKVRLSGGSLPESLLKPDAYAELV